MATGVEGLHIANAFHAYEQAAKSSMTEMRSPAQLPPLEKDPLEEEIDELIFKPEPNIDKIIEKMNLRDLKAQQVEFKEIEKIEDDK